MIVLNRFTNDELVILLACFTRSISYEHWLAEELILDRNPLGYNCLPYFAPTILLYVSLKVFDNFDG